ncbi:hypothetical protein NQ317_013691, partial [Molorchus minor]
WQLLQVTRKICRPVSKKDDTPDILGNASVSGSVGEIMSRILKGHSRAKYSPELRSFALTLSFYSTEAYNYVRRKFNMSLPHIKTISKWYRSVDGRPGFTTEALKAVKMKVDEAGHKILLIYLFIVITINWFTPFFLAHGHMSPSFCTRPDGGHMAACKNKGVCLNIKVVGLCVANLPHRNITVSYMDICSNMENICLASDCPYLVQKKEPANDPHILELVLFSFVESSGTGCDRPQTPKKSSEFPSTGALVDTIFWSSLISKALSIVLCASFKAVLAIFAKPAVSNQLMIICQK